MWKYKSVSLGCKVNTYESELLESQLSAFFSYDQKNPDLIIINTCVVTAVAESKSRQRIRKERKLHPHAFIVIMGCLPQINLAKSAELPVDLIISNSGKKDAFSLIKEHLDKREKLIHNPTFPTCYPAGQLLNRPARTRAYVKISDGCRHRCSYCIVSRIRGPFISRPLADIINEIELLVAQGCQEVVLTGIDIGSYGQDISSSLFLLLQAIEKTKLPRLRISSIELKQVSNDIINLIKNSKMIAPHLHIPLQSGSNRILKLMNRHYTREEYLQVVELARAAQIAVSADIIVGFPTETEQDFADTLELVQKAQFIKVHRFPYSIRPGTPAANMEQVSPLVIKAREAELGKVADLTYVQASSAYLNRELAVLIEEVQDGNASGYSGQYLPVIIEDDTLSVNQIVKVRLKKIGQPCLAAGAVTAK